MRRLGARSPGEQGSKFRLDAIVRRADHFAARDDDNVEGGVRFVMTEQFADQALGSIALDSGAHFPGRCYTETGRARLSFPRKHRHEASGALESRFVDEFEVGPLPDVLSGPEACHLLLV